MNGCWNTGGGAVVVTLQGRAGAPVSWLSWIFPSCPLSCGGRTWTDRQCNSVTVQCDSVTVWQCSVTFQHYDNVTVWQCSVTVRHYDSSTDHMTASWQCPSLLTVAILGSGWAAASLLRPSQLVVRSCRGRGKLATGRIQLEERGGETGSNRIEGAGFNHVWTTTKASASYVEQRRDDYIKGLFLPGS